MWDLSHLSTSICHLSVNIVDNVLWNSNLPIYVPIMWADQREKQGYNYLIYTFDLNLQLMSFFI